MKSGAGVPGSSNWGIVYLSFCGVQRIGVDRLRDLSAGSAYKSVSRHRIGYGHSFEPPSTAIVCPVIHRAASEARKAKTPPMSSGVAMRLSACIDIVSCRPDSV